MPSTYEDYFGYLDYGQPIEFRDGLVRPVPEFLDLKQGLKDIGAPDRSVYPPIRVHTKRSGADQIEVPRSQHNQEIQRLAISHQLILYRAGTVQDRVRRGRAGMVMHLLGFLYGYRCHFHDWWIDGRAFLRSDIDHIPPWPEQAALCLERSLDKWRNWNGALRRSILNTLYLHCRTRIYANDWERFQAEYQVFDAIFAISKADRPFRTRITHPGRFGKLCRRYRIPSNRNHIKHFVRLRNELIHEGHWDRKLMGDLGSLQALYASHRLHKLTRRLVMAVLGIRGPYVRSAWWGNGPVFWAVA